MTDERHGCFQIHVNTKKGEIERRNKQRILKEKKEKKTLVCKQRRGGEREIERETHTERKREP